MCRLIMLVLLAPVFAIAQTIAPPQFRAQWKIHSVDSTQDGDGSPQVILDGDPFTHWHTEWKIRSPGHPHEIAVDLTRPVEIAGFLYLPRQVKGSGMANGRIDRFEFLTSTDATNWTSALRGRFPESGDWQTNRLTAPVTARYIKLVSWSAFKTQPWAAVGELDLLLTDKSAAAVRDGK